MKKLFVVLCCIITVQVYGQDEYNESYKTLEVTGEMKSLTILGEVRTSTVVEIKEGKLSKTNYDVIARNKKLSVRFDEPTMDFVIRVPRTVGLVVKPSDIVFEGIFDAEKDSRKITIENMQGSIDVATDGYNVDLVRSKNDISVVSYLDIFADSIEMHDGGSISMDSYWGDVLLRPIPPLDANITMRAIEGMVEIDDMIEIEKEKILIDNNIAVIVGNGKSDILLHSEKGAHVLLDMQEELDIQVMQMEEELEKLDIQMQIADEEMRILELTDGVTDKYELFQNDPNPWRKSTKISYYLSEDEEVDFEFYDVEGNVIYSVTEKGEKGMNTLKVQGKSLSKKGILYYTMRVGHAKFTRKMIHLD